MCQPFYNEFGSCSLWVTAANEQIQFFLHTVQQTNGKVAGSYINSVFIISSFHTVCTCPYIGSEGKLVCWLSTHDCRWDCPHTFEEAVLNMVADALNHVHHTCISHCLQVCHTSALAALTLSAKSYCSAPSRLPQATGVCITFSSHQSYCYPDPLLNLRCSPQID